MLAPPVGTKLVGAYRKPADAGVRGAIGGYRRDLEAVYLIGEGWASGIGGVSSLLGTAALNVGNPSGIAARSGGHPHAKPLDLMEVILSRCPPGVIADPCAGSGSTLVAARNLGREAIGVELEEKYCEVIAKRLAQDCLDLAALS
jgi:site-specific DNA-methyltransferase (adenine-specific)